MRTVEEIKADVKRHRIGQDAEALTMLAAELAELGTPEAMAYSDDALGVAMMYQGNVRGALEQLERAKKAFEELGDLAGLASSYVSCGNAIKMMGDLPGGLLEYHRAMGLYQELGMKNGEAIAHSAIAALFLTASDYPQALMHFEIALSAFEDSGDARRAAFVYGGLGNLYSQTGDQIKALEFYERSIALLREHGHRAGLAINMGNMGIAYELSEQPEPALVCFRQALDLYRELGDLNGIAHAGCNIVQSLVRLGSDEDAPELMDELLALTVEEVEMRCGILKSHAMYLHYVGDLDQSHARWVDALRVAEEGGLRAEVVKIHENLRDLALEQKDFEGFVHHNAEFLRVQNEIGGREAMQKMAVMEVQRDIEAERQEREKERALLYGALPKSVADRRLRGDDVAGDHFQDVSVIFLDIVDFTSLSDRIPPGHVVYLLEQIFSAMDDVCAQHGVTKIKTIGDSYMAVAGVPEPLSDNADRAATCALEMMKVIAELQITMPPELGDTSWVANVGEINVRIGIHCGPATAGVIGKDRLQYDIWGDTVNVASRMESTGEAGRIQVSSEFHEQLSSRAGSPVSDLRSPKFTERGEVNIKGKGSMTTYWLEGA